MFAQRGRDRIELVEKLPDERVQLFALRREPERIPFESRTPRSCSSRRIWLLTAGCWMP